MKVVLVKYYFLLFGEKEKDFKVCYFKVDVLFRICKWKSFEMVGIKEKDELYLGGKRRRLVLFIGLMKFLVVLVSDLVYYKFSLEIGRNIYYM